MAERLCGALNEGGEPCRQAPLRDGEFCFWHSPEHAQEAAEARRLGGLRRRREHTVAGAYDFAGLDNVEQLRRVLQIATLDLLGLDNSIARGRALISAVSAGAKLLETGEYEERLRGLEEALKPRLAAVGGRRRR